MNCMNRLLATACAGLALAGCGDGFGSSGPGDGSVTVGSSNFPENALLAEIYAAALREQGLEVSTRLNIGSREILLPAMERGDVDVAPEYTGGLLEYVTEGRAGARDTSGQLELLAAELPADLAVLEPSRAQDQNTVTCAAAVAERYSLRSLSDLAPVSHEITIGGPPELATRGGFGSLDGLRRLYGIEFERFIPLDVGGPLTVSALKAGKIECANLFSTQSAIAANGFVTLADPKGFAQSEAVVPLVAKDVADPDVVAALDAVSARLTTDDLKEMVRRLEVDKEDAAAIAEEYLAEQGLTEP